MHTTDRPRTAEGLLGFGGLLLALVGSAGIVYLSEAVSGHSRILLPAVLGLIVPILVATALVVIPSTRSNSLIWLVTGAWCGFLAALTFWSVGIIFLIATVLLLAAFLNANWGS